MRATPLAAHGQAATAGAAAPGMLTLTARDGFPLAATAFGDAQTARAGVLIVGAMGVEQRFYAAFAQWLAARGFFVLSFDYRGIGRSRPAAFARSLRGFAADLHDWIERDVPAALGYAAERLGARPLFWLGHSLGAQIMPLAPGHERVAAMVAVAAGTGYWPQYAWRVRWHSWLLWYAVAPAATALAGYFPGQRLGTIGDLPAGVMRQWRRWCLRRDYCVGAEAAHDRYAHVRTPIFWLAFTDDEFMSRANVETMAGFYRNAPRTLLRIHPRTVGLRRIGHFGFFRPSAAVLWPRVADWLDAQAQQTHTRTA
ncbi:MAG: alpha/beta fold hydrolase [Burkholderiaceae bacterium]|nr:alpha/beta fold hydrolase [Burkholderiaceae bacterium]